MNEQNGNIEFIEILKERRNKGLLSQIADKITPIKETVQKSLSEDEYNELVASILDD